MSTSVALQIERTNRNEKWGKMFCFEFWTNSHKSNCQQRVNEIVGCWLRAWQTVNSIDNLMWGYFLILKCFLLPSMESFLPIDMQILDISILCHTLTEALLWESVSCRIFTQVDSIIFCFRPGFVELLKAMFTGATSSQQWLLFAS